VFARKKGVHMSQFGGFSIFGSDLLKGMLRIGGSARIYSQ